MESGQRVRLLVVLLALADVVAVAFIVGILVLSGSGVGLHEVAGLSLFILLLLALGTAYRSPPVNRRVLLRLVVAITALVVAGSLGAALAAGYIPSSAGGLPLVPLAALVIACSDGIRLLRRAPPFRS